MGRKSKLKAEQRAARKQAEKQAAIEAAAKQAVGPDSSDEREKHIQISTKFKIGAALILAAIVGTGLFMQKREESHHAPIVKPAATSPNKDGEIQDINLEERTWAMIHRVEKGIDQFKNRLEELEEHLPDEVAHDLREIITMVKNNQDFQKRNYVIAEREQIQIAKNGSFLYRSMEHHLLLNGDDSEERGGITPAMFFPPTWTVVVSEKINLKKDIELMILLHEIGHAKDLYDSRNAYHAGNLPGYKTVIKEAQGLIIESELKRYAYHIEILNAMTRGYLQKLIKNGINVMNDRVEVELLRLLNVKDYEFNNKFILRDTLRLAQIYYSGGGLTKKRVPVAFYKAIYSMYAQDKTYAINSNGQAVRLTPNNYTKYAEDAVVLD